MLFRQSRIFAATRVDAELKIAAAIKREGFSIVRLKLFPALVQCRNDLTWWEYVAQIKEGDQDDGSRQKTIAD